MVPLPSHKKYIPFSYGVVCDIVDGILEDMRLDPRCVLRGLGVEREMTFLNFRYRLQ